MKKVCIRCETKKNINEFYADKRLKDGHFGRCKECSKSWVASKEVKARRCRQSVNTKALIKISHF